MDQGRGSLRLEERHDQADILQGDVVFRIGFCFMVLVTFGRRCSSNYAVHKLGKVSETLFVTAVMGGSGRCTT